MTLTVYTDGGSKGNPGPSAIGMVFYDGKNKVYEYREDIGITTNNVAEYTAVIRALEYIKSNASSFKHQVSSIQFISDSTLLVNQLNGLFKIKNARIGELVGQVKTLEMTLSIPVSYTHVRREKNTEADALVNNKSI